MKSTRQPHEIRADRFSFLETQRWECEPDFRYLRWAWLDDGNDEFESIQMPSRNGLTQNGKERALTGGRVH